MPDIASQVGQTITCSTKDVIPGVNQIMCPGSSTKKDSCVLTYKQCVTCNYKSSTDVYIRYQSNGIPANCYRTQNDSTNFPKEQNIDFEVAWNRRVNN